VYLPYQPVSATLPPPPKVAAAEVNEVVAENASANVAESAQATTQAAANDTVTENVAANEIVTDPASFSLRALTLGQLALDWGVATIGSGTLMPTPGIPLGSGLGGFWPRGYGNNNNSSGGLSAAGYPIILPIVPNIINNNINNNFDPGCPCPPPPCPGPSPVPEPVSLVLWGVIWATLAVGAILRRRSASPRLAARVVTRDAERLAG
jgi:hypothetical protein